MTLVIACPECGMTNHKVPDAYLGRKVRCRRCGAGFTIQVANGNEGECFEAHCPECRTKFRDIPGSYRDRIVRCGKCRTSFRLQKNLPEKEPIDLGQTELEDVEPETALSSSRPLRDKHTTSKKYRLVKKAGKESGTDPKEGSRGWNQGDVILDMYQVAAVLGEGAMGRVYKVRHLGWNIDLAVKTPRAKILKLAGGPENFEREAETWVNLGLHPNIVSCYYVRRLDGVPRVFAEYVPGGSLEDWIENQKLYAGGPERALERILDIAIQFAWGLHYAHIQGVIHQDVKPANLMVTPDGAAKVTDFGLARAKPMAEIASDKTMGTIVMDTVGLTPAYASPEQTMLQPVGRRSDLWSWALSVLEMFTGAVTWSSGYEAMEALKEYGSKGPPQKDMPGMPIMVTEVLRQCFRDDPDTRPHNMRAVVTPLIAAYRMAVGKSYPRIEPKAGRDTADSLNNRAMSLLDLRRVDEAEALWEAALRVQPHHPQSTYNSGLVRWRTGRMTDVELVKEMGEVRTSHEGDWIDEYFLGQVHLERGDYETSVNVFQQVDGEYLDQGSIRSGISTAQGLLEQCRRSLSVLEHHDGMVSSVCLGLEGEIILTAWRYFDQSRRPCLKAFDPISGKYRFTLQGHLQKITSIDVSGDGCWAISGSDDRTARVWDLESGECNLTLFGHQTEVTSVAISFDGSRAVTGGSGGGIRIWDIAGDIGLWNKEAHPAGVSAVGISPDGTIAVTGGRGGELKVWDVAQGQCLAELFEHTDRILSVRIDDRTGLAVSGGADGLVILWNWKHGTWNWRSRDFGRPITSVGLCVDGEAAVSVDGRNIRIWKISNGQCLRTLTGKDHTGEVVGGLYPLENGNYQIFGLWGRAFESMELLPYSAPLMLSRIQTSEEMMKALSAFEKEMEQAGEGWNAGDYSKALRHLSAARSYSEFNRSGEAMELEAQLYQVLPHSGFRGGWEADEWREHDDRVTSVAFGRDRKIAVSGSGDRTVKVWDVDSGQVAAVLSGHTGHINSVSIHPRGTLAASGASDNTIRIWDTATGHCLHVLNGHDGYVTSVCFSRCGRFILSGGMDHMAKLWDATTGDLIHILQGHHDWVNSACLSADGRMALTGGSDNSIRLWDLDSGSPIRVMDGLPASVNAVCLSYDGRWALSGGLKGAMPTLWDLDNGRPRQTYLGHTGSITSTAMTIDGLYALTGSTDETIRLWEVETGRCLRTFEGHAAGVNAIGLCDDARYFLSGSNDRTIRVWVLDWALEEKPEATWDDAAETYIRAFLSGMASNPGQTAGEKETGKDDQVEEIIHHLIHVLGCAGFGWISEEKVREMVRGQ